VINSSRWLTRNVNRLVKDPTTTLFDRSQQHGLANQRLCIFPIEIASHCGSRGDANLMPLILSTFGRKQQAIVSLIFAAVIAKQQLHNQRVLDLLGCHFDIQAIWANGHVSLNRESTDRFVSQQVLKLQRHVADSRAVPQHDFELKFTFFAR
jgi:hypothetical protein